MERGRRRREQQAVRQSRLLTSTRWEKGGGTIQNPHLRSLVTAVTRNYRWWLLIWQSGTRARSKSQATGNWFFFILLCISSTQWCFFLVPAFGRSDQCAVFPSTLSKWLSLLLEACSSIFPSLPNQENRPQPPLRMPCGTHCHWCAIILPP